MCFWYFSFIIGIRAASVVESDFLHLFEKKKKEKSNANNTENNSVLSWLAEPQGR